MGTMHPILVAELRETRIAADKLRVEKATALARVAELEEENEALRETVATLARAAGGGGVL
jgi:hypothetical protein